MIKVWSVHQWPMTVSDKKIGGVGQVPKQQDVVVPSWIKLLTEIKKWGKSKINFYTQNSAIKDRNYFLTKTTSNGNYFTCTKL